MAAVLDLGNLLVHLRADASQYMAMMATVEARMRLMSQRMITIGRTMSLYVTAPLLLLGGASVKAFASFDDAMTKSLAIMSGITPQLREEMESLALSISSKGVVSAKDLARSYFYLASAGLDARQSMAALGTVEEFAVAGAFDMALATDLLTDAQSALGLTVKDAQQNMVNMTRVADVLTGANTLANATTQQFSEALTSQAGPAMKAYNIELEEGVAVLAAYADQGIKAQRAGNMLSRMLRLMTKGFQDNRGAWERYNVDIFDTTGELKPLYTIIGDLSGVLNSMSTEQKIAALQMLGFQARSQQAILPLLGLQDNIKKYNDALLEMRGITEEVVQKQLKSFSSQMKILWNQIRNTAIGIGRMLAPSLLSLNENLKRAVAYWNLMEESSKRNVIMFAVLAAVIGPVLIATGLLLKLLAFMIVTVNTLTASFVGLATAMWGPIGIALLLASIAYALRAAWVQNVTAIKDVMEDFFNIIRDGFEGLSNDVVVKFLTWLTKNFFQAFQDIGKGWKDLFANLAANIWAAEVFVKNIWRGWTRASEMWAEAYMTAFEKAHGFVIDLQGEVISGFEADMIVLKELGSATVQTLKELLDAVKTQFGQDADALVALIKSKMLKLKVPEGETPLFLAPADISEIETEMKRLLGVFEDVGERVDRMKTPMEEWADNARDVATRVGEVFANTFQKMGDELADFLIEGEADFHAFAKAILKDLLAIYLRAQVVMPMASALGLLSVGSAPTPFQVGTPPPIGYTGGTPMHKGGVVPRLHGGLAPDEFHAILQSGETVIPKGGNVSPSVIINNNTGVAFKQKGSPFFNGKDWVVSIVAEDITQFGILRQMIKGI